MLLTTSAPGKLISSELCVIEDNAFLPRVTANEYFRGNIGSTRRSAAGTTVARHFHW